MSRLKTALLLGLAVPSAVSGAWALAAPSSWHSNFPGFGRDWLPTFGAYNEHVARDFGGALLGLALLLACAALWPRVPLRRAAPAAFLVFAVPHFAFHVANTGGLPTGDEIANQVSLFMSVAIPAALLLLPDRTPLRIPPRGPDGWRLPAAKPRGLVPRVAFAFSRRRYGHVLGPIAVTAHNPLLLAGYSAFELALERADRIDRRLEELAATRAATLTGCPFCIDFAYSLLSTFGFSASQVREIPVWRESAAFSADERLVLEYADAMSATPVEVSDELFDRLRARFDEAAIVELTAAIALENYRGRFNHAVGLTSEGFCEVAPASGNGRPTPAGAAA